MNLALSKPAAVYDGYMITAGTNASKLSLLSVQAAVYRIPVLLSSVHISVTM